MLDCWYVIVLVNSTQISVCRPSVRPCHGMAGTRGKRLIIWDFGEKPGLQGAALIGVFPGAIGGMRYEV